MNKLIIVLLLVFVGFLPLPVSAKSLSTHEKTQACAQKNWTKWKKDKFCMKLLKKQYHPNPIDKQGKKWLDGSWRGCESWNGYKWVRSSHCNILQA